MRVGIVGAGFTGLSAAYYLSKSNVSVKIFEGENQAGGLAAGFKEKDWDWELDQHYHHLFTSDTALIKLASQLGVPIHFYKQITSTLTFSGVHQLDSPLSLLKFKDLPFIDRLRTGVLVGYLRYFSGWKNLENSTAKDFLIKYGGEKSWHVLWEPLFKGKFHHYYDQVNAAWFWSRIKKRSSQLGYPDGGFAKFAKALSSTCVYRGVEISYSTRIAKISAQSPKIVVQTQNGEQETFDKLIFTGSSSSFDKLLGQKTTPLPYLGAVNLVLSLARPLIPGNAYWLNINVAGMPFLSAVEHTNLIPAKYYSSTNLVYLGNYVPAGHPYLSMNAESLLKVYLPGISRINPDFKASWVKKCWVWQSEFAQPIPTVGYSKLIPPIVTPYKGIYLANMQQVYPWDRGTNYAVDLGQKTALLCAND